MAMTPQPGGGNRLARLAPYALVAFLYVATWPFHNGLNNPNEMVRVYMTKAMVDDQTMAIDAVMRQWGGVDDKAIREGKLYSSKAPLQSLVGVPVYAAHAAIAGDTPPSKREITTVLRWFAAALPGALVAFALIFWARRRCAELGAAEVGTGLGLVLALGTMLYPYAITFTGHILAAATAGGCYLAVVLLRRAEPGSRRWLLIAAAIGFLGGAAPFAEYPSALVAAPAIVCALVVTGGIANRLRLLGMLALGGAAPFGLGLWAHHQLWGSPVKTGYGFLENTGYVEVHSAGFFGVTLPKADAFFGSLLSPGTGLFFFSPIMAAGLVAMIAGLFDRREDRLGRGLALAGVVGFAASIIFISGHTGWRGGWTVGPRYIIALAPLLGIWAVEGVRIRWLRPLLPALGAVSIVATGFAAALYPHLSDVYTNPLASFVWPSYVNGETTYGLAHSLGASGTWANLMHVLPLTAAVLFAGLIASGERWPTRIAALVAVLGAFIALVALIGERDAAAAQRENARLWGFWEPTKPRIRPEGLLFSAYDDWRTARVEAEIDGRKVPCRWASDRCDYGGMPWQHYGPDFLELDGAHHRLLFLHPIKGWTVRVSYPVPAAGRRAVLLYGLTDASVDSDNPTPVRMRLKQGDKDLSRFEAVAERGLKSIELALGTQRAPLTLEVESERDGARVIGFDLQVLP